MVGTDGAAEQRLKVYRHYLKRHESVFNVVRVTRA
jgi:hypothetical protein